MRSLKYIILIPVLLYAAVMGYLWYEVKSGADEMVASAAGFADIKYDSVHVSLTGDEIGLNNIVIKPNMTQDEFRIEKARFSVPHVGYFIQAGGNIGKGKLPEKIGMKIERMHVDLNSQLFTMMEQMQQQAAAQGMRQDMPLASLDALGCGELERFTIADYRRMGIGQIVGDATVDMRYDESSNRTHLTVHMQADNLYGMDMQANIDTAPDMMNASAAAGSVPDMDIEYRDNGYYRLRNDYCASLNDSDVNSYVERHIQLAGNSLGASFPEPFVKAYRQYLLKGGTVKAKIRPATGLPVNGLQYYAPGEIIDMLGLQLRINGTALNTKQVAWDGKRPEAVASAEPVKPAPPAAVKEPSRPAMPAPAEPISYQAAPSFHVVDITNASQHRQKTVEVTLFDGKVRRGMLEDVHDGRIYLIMQLQGGSLSYPVKVSEVKQLRVKY